MAKDLGQIGAKWAILLNLAVFSSAQAHHSLAAHYALGDVRQMTGTIVSIEWANPHIEIELAVENEQGALVTWQAEGGSVNTLTRNGITRNLFEVGGTITVTGPVSRFGRPEMIVARAAYSGEQYSMFPAVANALFEPSADDDRFEITAAGYEVITENAPDIFRVWVPIEFPATGLRYIELPLTAQAKTAFESYDTAAGDLAAKCIAAGMPSMLDQPYPVEFLDNGDVIVVRFEEWNGRRNVYMGDQASGDGAESIFGQSIGRWEGATLVIETRAIHYPFYDDAGAPLTTDAIVTERYTLRADGSRLDWSSSTTDPNVFTAPATMGGSMAFAPEVEIEDFQCDVD